VNILWVRIRSFHALSDYQGIPRTLCGRSPSRDSDVYDRLPAGRSCESCLRIVARKTDNDPVNEDVGE
jgi:hypothetical protein